MSENVALKIKGLDDLDRALRGAPKELRIEARQALTEAGSLLKDEMARRIHSPSGRARKGLRVKVKSGTSVRAEGASGLSVRIYPGNRQGIFSQRSRRPNTTPPSDRAARAIARRYGIPVRNAPALALAIGRRGTVGHPVAAAALAAGRSRTQQAFHKALERITKKIASQVHA